MIPSRNVLPGTVLTRVGDNPVQRPAIPSEYTITLAVLSILLVWPGGTFCIFVLMRSKG